MNTFFSAVDIFMLQMHLKQLKFTYSASACGTLFVLNLIHGYKVLS